MQACRLPVSMNGVIPDSAICASSIRVTPIYAFAGSATSNAIGSLITFRTVAGYLVATARFDCPWQSYFSYNGKTPATAGYAAQDTTTTVSGRRRRGLAAKPSSSTTTTTCPQLTSNGTVLAGQGHDQYQNGRPDSRSYLFIKYKVCACARARVCHARYMCVARQPAAAVQAANRALLSCCCAGVIATWGDDG